MNVLDLIENSVINAGGFGNLQEFYATIAETVGVEAKWKKLFKPTSPTIDEKWEQQSDGANVTTMAHIISRESEPLPIFHEGARMESGSMPTMSQKDMFNSKEIRDNLKIMRYYEGKPDYENLYNHLIESQTALIMNVHARINHMAFQVESKGLYTTSAVDNTGGIIGLTFDMNHQYKRGCGEFGKEGKKKIWSDPDSDPIGDLLDMRNFARKEGIIVNVIRIGVDAWDNLLNHPSIKKYVAVKDTKGLINTDNLDYYTVEEEDVRKFLKQRRLPDIEVVDEENYMKTVNSFQEIESRSIQSFDKNAVVFRASGYVGTGQFTFPLGKGAKTEVEPKFSVDDNRMLIEIFNSSREHSAEVHVHCTGLPVHNTTRRSLILETNVAV